jgi:cytochrome c peroxidase
MKIFYVLCFVLMSFCVFNLFKQTPIEFNIPKNWPEPAYSFKLNPLTKEKFELGKSLFYDPILSSDSSISCASCHLSYTGFTHGDHAISHGVGGKLGTRNSLTLINLAWSNSFMWDGGINNLEVQAISPITHESEMNETLENILKKLNRSDRYKILFKSAYNDETIDSKNLLKALAQFTVRLVSANSKYDSVLRHEKQVKFTDQEEKGYKLYRKNCAVCHTEPLFTNNKFENIGLSIDPELKDIGRMKITFKREDSLKFKVPTLRNIEFSAPYFHDGRAKKLKDVIEHYSNGIHKSHNVHPVLQNGFNLSSTEKIELISFLKTLSDKKFLYNSEYRMY